MVQEHGITENGFAGYIL